MLLPDDFTAFFLEVHGVPPFPWQQRLLSLVAAQGWPGQLHLPTSSGKTAAIDIAVFHLALEAARGEQRQAPVRIAFVVNRRLVVDDAHERACKLQKRLSTAPAGSVTAAVAQALRALSLDNDTPLLVRRLRGGLPREGDWARTPSQPTVLCSTVDQIGSRLLFRGYGVSDSMKPVHAGLIGADCLILLDEAHLAEPFRQTLDWVGLYRGDKWRESKYAAPWRVALLTATPQPAADSPATQAAAELPFALNDDDHATPELRRRLQASKPARLRLEGGEDLRRQAFVDEVQRALGANLPVVGVVLNRVARARDLFNELRRAVLSDSADLLLLIGPARSVERDKLARQLQRIRTGAERTPRPLVVVATQCIEAGVDIDFDALFTEAAPLDALRQRFGRLNRSGREINAMAAIIATKEDVGARADDLVYGTATREAWADLMAVAQQPGADAKKRKGDATADGPVVEFGISRFAVPLRHAALTQPADAPVLMPAHVDLLSQTAPVPGADPEVALHLHGPKRQPDAVTVIWRADLNTDVRGQDMLRLLTLMPPRAGEAIELPVWAVRRWLQLPEQRIDGLADLPSDAPDDDGRTRGARGREVFRWRGLNDGSHWMHGGQVRAGDTIVLPTRYGGADEHGWDPSSNDPATDVADDAARHLQGQYFALRVAPGLVGRHVTLEQLAEVLSRVQTQPWKTVRDALRSLLEHMPPGETADPAAESLHQLLTLLDGSRRKCGRERLEMHFDIYGTLNDDQPRGVVFVAPRGLRTQEGGRAEPDGTVLNTEDDLAGSVAGFALSLQQHSADVEITAEAFARAVGLPRDRVADLKLAGWLHDQGKRDPRFQRWLHHGDPLGADPEDESSVLAKSGRALPAAARAKAGLPPRWRHEALSVLLARRHHEARLQQVPDADLVLWLVGTHHGHGRPLFPHADPTEPDTDPGPQSPAFDWNGGDWPVLFDVLKARYGTWELARMEAILRLADHRASEQAASLQANADEAESAGAPA